MAVMKENVIQAISSNQMCSGQDKGCSAAIHSMRQSFDDEAVLLVDADNAFNRINSKALLRNINMLYPIFGRYLNNCYRIPFRLFVIGRFVERGNDSKDPTEMAIYPIGITLLVNIILELITAMNMVAFADNITAAISQKSWLIVKPKHEEKIREIFRESKIQISTRG